jgi:outer membrane protein assembly factor BamB
MGELDCDRSAVWPQFQRTAAHGGKLSDHTLFDQEPDLTELTATIKPDTAPVVGGGRCYFNEGDGLTAVERETGERLWHAPFETVSSGSPVVGCGIVAIQTGSELLALRAEDGTKLWQREYGHGGTLPNLLVDDQGLYVGEGDELRSISHRGESRWQASRSERFTGIASIESTVVACSAGAKRDGSVQAFDRDEGAVHWSVSGINPQTPPAIDDTNAYLTDKRGTVYALDVESGDLAWETQLQGQNTYATVAIDGDRDQLYVPTGSTGDVLALDRASGEERWRTDVGTYAGVEVVHTGDQLYVLANALYALRPSDGSVVWHLEKPVQSGPMALTEDALYLNSRGSLMRAVSR